MSEKLEPCPFCGCAVGLVTGFEYSTVRGDHALTCVFLDDEPMATAAEWNSRAQRDEGLAREAELQAGLASAKADKEAYGHNAVALRLRANQLQERLAEAEKAVKAGKALLRESWAVRHDDCLQGRVEKYLSSPGCADGEKAS